MEIDPDCYTFEPPTAQERTSLAVVPPSSPFVGGGDDPVVTGQSDPTLLFD